MTRRVFWQRPALRTDEDEGIDRAVTWLELFYDLVFVVVIAGLAHELSIHPEFSQLPVFLFSMLPVWLIWNGFTYYAERFETEGFENRLVTFVMIAGVAGLAVFSHDSLGENYQGFAGTYLMVRGFIIFLWIRAGLHNRMFLRSSARFTLGYIICLILVVVSFFRPEGERMIWWGLGVLAEVIGPWLTVGETERLPAFSHNKLPERFGLMVIIVLGESVAGAIRGIAGEGQVSLPGALLGVLGLMLGFMAWCLYFDFIGRRRPPRGKVFSSWLWSYLHLPLVIVTAVMGAMLAPIVTRDADTASQILSVAVGSFLIILAALELTLKYTDDEPTHRILSPLLKVLTGCAALLMAPAHESLAIPVFMMLLVAVMWVNAGYGLWIWFTQDLDSRPLPADAD
ncbi:MAG: low temperature requirement protein A [Deltaproteobacteria bacterium]|nr:low temperature requirement protein A [Candidatus Zymogenaceae bacterium]